MEVAVGTAAGKIAPKLFDFLETNRKLRRELEHDIEYIKREFVMLSAVIEEDGDHPPWSGNQVHKVWIQMVRDLSHAIEDCIDHFIHRVTLHPSASWIHRRFHRVKTVRARNKFAAAIRRLRKRSEDASKMRTSYTTNNDGVKSNINTLGSDEQEMDMGTSVGMDEPLDELMELIREGQQPKEEHKLKVISVVGFGGIGKTRLARQAYNDTIEKTQYEAWAWVHAADKGAEDVLKEILRKLGAIISGGGLSKLRRSLKQCLGNKRFFIVIDDMRKVLWHDVKEAFPVVEGVSSRVVVTTTIQSVANACSSAHGHAYVMRTLAEEHSRQLFFQKASLKEDSPQPNDHTQLGTSEALMKCDGLPLALVTTAQFLQSRGDPRKWANLCENLGGHLETEDTLASMNRVLIRSYGSLGSQDVKTFLLYLGIYPTGHPIRRGILIRRWLAEGFINQDHRRSALCVAVEIFDKLVDRSIIQPIDASSSNNNSVEVKKCQTHGMMLEFILHKSTCENFVTLLCDKDPQPRSNIRWLSLQHKTAAKAKMNPKDLRLVRSLTIFGKAHSSMLDFSKYKLMRVLDLEECKDKMGDRHLKDICNNLLLIRYLSLGGAITVTMLPKEIKKLKLLETLDVRRTNIEILPTEVMKLPCLVHLFGKFKLQEGVGHWRMLKLQTWLRNKSKMETMAGFVVGEDQKMPQLIDHMEHLTKLKIWCESTSDVSVNVNCLSTAIKRFIERSTNLNKAHSLSLNFNARWPQDLLSFTLEKDKLHYLRSLKLQGNNICSQLPWFVTNLYLVTKLCLSFPGHNLGGHILDALSKVRGLEHLKLIATQMDKLIIRQGAFRILQSLCIMVEVMTGLEIEEGAVQHLDSLQLLCKDLNGFSSTTIHSLPLLKEVALHDELSDRVKQDWKGAAKNHPGRPKVLFKLKGSELAAGTSTAATTTNTLAQEVAIGSEPAENFESPAAPPTDITVSTPPGDISTEESVQVATSEMESETVAELPVAPGTTDDTTLSLNHNAFASAQQEYPGNYLFVVVSDLILVSENGLRPTM
ncbi:hypothetical protein VPH35_133894 [Triticum aestivum]